MLDIGWMKRRGAERVVGIDSEDYYLRQARFAADVLGYRDIEYRNLSVYDVAALGERFDPVIFMGVFYHRRHPLLAPDLLHEHAVGDLLVFQSMLRGSTKVDPIRADCSFWDMEHFNRPGCPRMHFVEHRYAGDPTNWWVADRAEMEAMLRSSGFEIVDHPEAEVFVCRRGTMVDRNRERSTRRGAEHRGRSAAGDPPAPPAMVAR